jgi:sodium/bile acid cotransporter 7
VPLRLRPDSFTLALLATVALASLLPCPGGAARIFDIITDAVIALLLLMHDATLPRMAIVQGRLARRRISGFVEKHKPPLGLVDQGTILPVVCEAFSAAVVGGIWRDTPLSALLYTPGSCALLPALVITTLMWIARRLGYSREEKVACVLCGSGKSLACAIPMAWALLAGVPGGHGTLALITRTVVACHQADRGARRAGDDSHEAG